VDGRDRGHLHGVENAEDVELPSWDRFAASAKSAKETCMGIILLLLLQR
jgi:hypothetical protein